MDRWAAVGKRGPHSADSALVLLRSAYRWGMDEEEEDKPDVFLVTRDPTRGIESFVSGESKDRTRSLLNREGKTDAEVWKEVVQFWKGTASMPVIPRVFVRLLLVLGLRRGETRLALWKNVRLDDDHPTWFLPAEDRKGRVAGKKGVRKPLTVPLHDLAVGLLRELREVTGSEGRLFRKLSMSATAAKMREATGLDDLHLHDLRRSCYLGLQTLGAPPHVCSAILGHVEKGGAQSDRTYARGTRAGEVEPWLRRWSEFVSKLAGEGEPGKIVAAEFGKKA